MEVIFCVRIQIITFKLLCMACMSGLCLCELRLTEPVRRMAGGRVVFENRDFCPTRRAATAGDEPVIWRHNGENRPQVRNGRMAERKGRPRLFQTLLTVQQFCRIARKIVSTPSAPARLKDIRLKNDTVSVEPVAFYGARQHGIFTRHLISESRQAEFLFAPCHNVDKACRV